MGTTLIRCLNCFSQLVESLKNVEFLDEYGRPFIQKASPNRNMLVKAVFSNGNITCTVYYASIRDVPNEITYRPLETYPHKTVQLKLKTIRHGVDKL